MKFLPSQLLYFMRSRVTQRNLGVLARFSRCWSRW
jgi:hypothetical protein